MRREEWGARFGESKALTLRLGDPLSVILHMYMSLFGSWSSQETLQLVLSRPERHSFFVSGEPSSMNNGPAQEKVRRHHQIPLQALLVLRVCVCVHVSSCSSATARQGDLPRRRRRPGPRPRPRPRRRPLTCAARARLRGK